MTIKEAIMLLNPKTTASALAEIEYYNGFSGKEACIEAIEEACRLAIEALEKQVPKKPIEYEDTYYGCPTCGNVAMMKWEKYPDIPMSKIYGLPYCLECGQRLDWGDSE